MLRFIANGNALMMLDDFDIKMLVLAKSFLLLVPPGIRTLCLLRAKLL